MWWYQKICIDNHIGGGVVRSFCLLSVYRGNGCGSGVADAGRSGSDFHRRTSGFFL